MEPLTNQSTNQPINYLLHLADNALIMAQRLSEWTGHGPALEPDIAVSNMALDYLGQCRNCYQYAARMINENGLQRQYPSGSAGDIDEDDLAYLRTEREFKNHLLVELPNGDWAQSMLKIFLFSTYQKSLYAQLKQCDDAQLAAIAEKSLKEVSYHQRWSADWVVRLGDGTEESHGRLKHAVGEVWPYVGEFFERPSYDPGWVDYAQLKGYWFETITKTMEEATLSAPGGGSWQEAPSKQQGGLSGLHTEYMGFLLAELQYMQRTYPGNAW